ncbi:hypothetical protein G9529_002949 [Salmonella enterica]|nr:hypothetical protein [Salmonella enterica]EJO5565200.1 hypothetical protein [Salmonella enterica]
MFPAPAGINRDYQTIYDANFSVPRASSSAGNDRMRVPRASGDKPPENYLYRRLDMCSPRQRG